MTRRSPLQLQALPYFANSAHWMRRIRHLRRAVWLDSAWPYSQRGRYDIISAAPLATFDTASGDTATGLAGDTVMGQTAGEAFATAQALLSKHLPTSIETDLPFSGGVIALFGYESGRALHGLSSSPAAVPATPKRSASPSFASTPDFPATPNFPATIGGIYSWAIVVDHQLQRTTLVMREETPAPLREQILSCIDADGPGAVEPFALVTPWRDEFPEAEYRAAFARLQDYISAGDCYQVNLARRFSAGYRGDPLAAYLHLRETAAAPFSAYLEHDAGAVLSLSPERFLAAENHQLLTQPIKGTAPRSADKSTDADNAKELQDSEKNRAENLMIVDLLRNDLGRSCVPGSIRVEQLFELQSFATVHHLVSSIRGELRPDLQPLDALRHCFPGGSITGAPKFRAMQIIDELEPHPRSVFCGAIAYIDAGGKMDSNITIRTLLACDQHLYAWAGGGIVADSQADAELRETGDKIGPLLKALENPR